VVRQFWFEQHLSLDQVGCEARKIPAVGDVFFLDFSFYRTYQELERHRQPGSWVVPAAT
jgi:hypothetical protein